MSGPGAGTPFRNPERLLALIREEGTELVPDMTAQDGGIYRLGDVVFVAGHGATEPTGPFESLLDALEAVGEEALRSGENVVWRWRDAAITVEDGAVQDVCHEDEWLHGQGRLVLEEVVDGGCNSSWSAVVRWHEHYFWRDDEGVIETGLDHPHSTLEAAWAHGSDGVHFAPSGRIRTFEIPPEEVARRFGYWDPRHPEPVRINGQLYWLRGEAKDAERPDDADRARRCGAGDPEEAHGPHP